MAVLLRRQQAYIREQNKKFTSTLRELSYVEMLEASVTADLCLPPFKAWRSNRFLVQAFQQDHDVIRLSVTRTLLLDNGRFADGVTWDELQTIKRAVGYGAHEAVEIYPPDRDLVDVANMRHLWILPARLPFSWRS